MPVRTNPTTTPRTDARERFRRMSREQLADEQLALLDRLDSPNADEQDLAESEALNMEMTARSLADDRREALGSGTVVRRSHASPDTGRRERDAVSDFLADYTRAGGAGRVQRDMDTRAVLTLPGAAPSVHLGIVGLPDLPTTLLDALGVTTVSEGTVTFMKDTSDPATNPAVVVDEARAKPEAGFTFEMDEATTKTVAVWAAMSRQWMQDVEGGESYIRVKLTGLVRARLEHLAVQTLMTEAGDTSVTADSALVAILTAAASLTGKGYTPGVAAVNSTDWLTQSLATNSSGSWLGLPPGITLPPIVTTPSVPSGSVIVMDRSAATVLVRDALQLLLADQHADLFLKNTLIALAETRAATVVLQPGAVALATITTPAP